MNVKITGLCSIHLEGKTSGKFIPDFTYYLVLLRDYSNEDLLKKRIEISLVMLVNKLLTAENIESFRRLPVEESETILKDSPAYLVNVVADVLKVFLLKMNVPVLVTESLQKRLQFTGTDDFIKILVYNFILVSLFIDFLKSIC